MFKRTSTRPMKRQEVIAAMTSGPDQTAASLRPHARLQITDPPVFRLHEELVWVEARAHLDLLGNRMGTTFPETLTFGSDIH